MRSLRRAGAVPGRRAGGARGGAFTDSSRHAAIFDLDEMALANSLELGL